MKNIMKKGFTLAEILIVLTIIGVMAVMTIPSLIQNSNSQQKIAMFKKAFTSAVNAYSTEFALKSAPKNPDDIEKMFNALSNQLNVKYYQEMTSGEKIYTKPQENIAHYWIVTEDGIGYRVSYASNIQCNKKIDINAQKNGSNSLRQSCGHIEVITDALKKGIVGVSGDKYAKAMCSDSTNLEKINCEIMRFYVAKDGITSGNPDCVFAGRVMSDNTVYDETKCSEN